MHIPDAFIPMGQALIYWIIALIFIALALRWARRSMEEEKIPLVAVLAAGIFAIQALNIPIPWGTSGHMVGAALAAIVLGSPYAGVFVLTLVLLVQGVIFGDGGITVMGANIVNMGVIGGFVGYYGYTAVKNVIGNAYAAAFIAGWASLFISAILCAVELAIAGTFPLVPALIGLGLYHAVIGLIEGGITAGALYLIASARPDILEHPTGVSA
ncbi:MULTISPECIES: cobalt transporter CbiM [unclassified Methanoculleus]|uniref:cobalt transporter CbiM n=1 Tax=unclassified Methanoculleus TaxID=2619537 RepID=UPI0025F54CF4|nr:MULTISPECIES: cobalt transporter CbiM [unclassified Methanoculleus]MCK9317047.1 cobalt transporter CbiM [Methanoculleus sp.]MDD2253996.1 cobalt transporter CbiM [Methanoculleus sp.]MDD2788330.1 cobalt transporter CbiM [Methanoculleus sp.]MDD3217488.1 cobalt transporter CbiM [Methanoculleus sp.]MDD4315483.1 cobalt transporter CbiM [Methanoculleus sp.]